MVGLRNKLHVGVLDAIVDHLNEVARSVRTDIGHARPRIGLRRNGFEDRTDVLVRFLVAARHERWAVTGSFLTARNPDAEEPKACVGIVFLAPAGVLVPGITSVDNDVALVQQWFELAEHDVHRRARLDHHHNLSRSLQSPDQPLETFCGPQPIAALRDRLFREFRLKVVTGY